MWGGGNQLKYCEDFMTRKFMDYCHPALVAGSGAKPTDDSSCDSRPRNECGVTRAKALQYIDCIQIFPLPEPLFARHCVNSLAIKSGYIQFFIEIVKKL